MPDPLPTLLRLLLPEPVATPLLDHLDDPAFLAEQVRLWLEADEEGRADILDVIENGLPQEAVDEIVVHVSREGTGTPSADELKVWAMAEQKPPLKRVRLKIEIEFPEDTARIVRVMAERGYECSPEQAVAMWERYSDDEYWGWIDLPSSDDRVFEAIKPYFEEAVDAR